MIATSTEVKFNPSTLPQVARQPDDFPNKSELEVLPEIPSIKLRRKSSDWTEEMNHLGLPAVEAKISGTARQDGTMQPTESDSALFSRLQQGIRASLDRLHTYPERDLLMTDFSFIEENHFGCNSNDSRCYTLHVYAPVAFRFFREVFGITTEDFRRSICDSRLHQVRSCNSSRGSAFYATADDRFILKTVPKEEAKFLIDLFPGYFLNLTQHTKTLLPKYYGLFSHATVLRTVRVLVMNNILPRSYHFCEKYDLKGSTYLKRRHAEVAAQPENDVTLKDLDILRNWPKGFYLPSRIYDLLLKSIARDCKVLESYSIMDYSLLLGIFLPCDSDSGNEEKPEERYKRNRNLIGPFKARNMRGETVYLFMGIIDILQSYTWKKKLECHLKSLVYGRQTISVNSPGFYAERLQDFLTSHVFKRIPVLVPSTKKDHWDIERSTAAGF